jgi:predicted RND superfamily exporter protein
VRSWVDAPLYGVEALPPQIAEAFGTTGSVVVIYSDDREERIEDIYGYADLLRQVKQYFPDVKLGSDVIVLSEIIRYVLDDGRIVAVLFLLGVFVVLWLDFRSVKEALVLEGQLVAGMALLVGLMGLVKVPFTVINVAMIPAVLAAGIDMGVHVRHRELELGSSPIEAARSVAQAVHLGALTTLVGFGSLFVTRAEMLRGIAWISCLGQVAMYLVCMAAFPLAKEAIARLHARRSGARAATPSP